METGGETGGGKLQLCGMWHNDKVAVDVIKTAHSTCAMARLDKAECQITKGWITGTVLYIHKNTQPFSPLNSILFKNNEFKLHQKLILVNRICTTRPARADFV